MDSSLTSEALHSVKRSYFNILAFFFTQEQVETRFVRCLLKWGFQLQLTRDDINRPGKELEQLKFTLPQEKVERLEELYHLVYMVNLDKVVEDVELEVASLYAERLGFKATLVPDLLKSIATAAYDGISPSEVKREVLEFLKVNSI
ncbi:MAG: hypothetical protein ACOYW3_02090 [Bacteroidota bacterium]